MKSVGIDLGRYSVKMAEVESSHQTFTLRRLEEFPLSTDPTKDTEIETLDILRKISNQYDHNSTTFVVGMSQEQIITRNRLFPFRERHKILKAIPFELEDDIPFPGEQALFDGKITRFRGSGAEVIACTTPIDRIKTQLRRLHNGNIDPSILSPEGVAFANLFENWSSPPPEGTNYVLSENNENESNDLNLVEESPTAWPSAQVFLNIGHRSTFFIVRAEDRLLSIRSIDWGGYDLAAAISSNYHLHIIEAYKELKKKGFLLISEEGATKDQIAFSQTIKDKIDVLAHHLHLSFLEIESDHQIKISQLFMCGGVSQLRQLGPYLTQKLEISCNRLKQISGNASLFFDTDEGKEAAGAVAISLAIEGLKKPRNPATNLLRGELAKQSQTFKNLIDKWGHSIAVASVSFFVLLIWSVLRESMAINMVEQANEQLKIQAQNITGGTLKGAKASPSNILKYIKEKEKEAQNRKLAEKVQTISSALEVLKNLSESTPTKKKVTLDVTSLRIKNENVEIMGSAANASQISQLMTSWKSLALGGKLEKIPDSDTKKGPGGKADFGVRFKVERLKGG